MESPEDIKKRLVVQKEVLEGYIEACTKVIDEYLDKTESESASEDEYFDKDAYIRRLQEQSQTFSRQLTAIKNELSRMENP